MTGMRRRRITPLKKPVLQIRKKRSISSEGRHFNWGSSFLKGMTVLICFLVLILIVSAISRKGIKIPNFIKHVMRNTSEIVDRPKLSTDEGVRSTAPIEDQVMRIEVLNGCGVKLLAKRYTDFLRDLDYDVVTTDNYESKYVEYSVVINRQGNNDRCYKLANDLGIEQTSILKEENAIYLIDATVILGKNFRSLSSWKIVEQDYDGS